MNKSNMAFIHGFFLLIGFGIAAAVLWGWRQRKSSDSLKGALESLRQEVQFARTAMSTQIQAQTQQQLTFLQSTQSDYQSTLGSVAGRLGQLQQSTAQMLEAARDLSELQSILQHPKLRGGLGEFLLEELLAQILPQCNYTLQWPFSDGVKVDAVVRLREGLVPVDSKFPLENFRRILNAENEDQRKSYRRIFINDVKKHCDDIAQKYIRPSEGTLDFALLFIPAEYVYYEAFLSPDEETYRLQAYALKNKIIAVSPQGLYAYLEIIARGLKGHHVEKAAQVILGQLNQLEHDFTKAIAEFEKTGLHLKNAQAAYERNGKQWTELRNGLDRLSSVELRGPHGEVLHEAQRDVS